MPRINVSRVLKNSKFKTSISVQRFAGIVYDEDGLGIKCGDDDALITIRGSLQPSTPKERQLLPEGVRNSESIVILSLFKFRMETPDGSPADVIKDHDERDWVVSYTDNWLLHGWYRAVCVALNSEVC